MILIASLSNARQGDPTERRGRYNDLNTGNKVKGNK